MPSDKKSTQSRCGSNQDIANIGLDGSDISIFVLINRFFSLIILEKQEQRAERTYPPKHLLCFFFTPPLFHKDFPLVDFLCHTCNQASPRKRLAFPKEVVVPFKYRDHKVKLGKEAKQKLLSVN